MKRILTILLAIIIPGSGHVILKRETRGLMMVFWMFAMGYITYHLTDSSTSFIGRYSGGLLIHILSVVEVCNMSKLDSKKNR
ncbi:MAG TPA: DUF6677 family protein [Anaerovoracaceae bacterium]|nr:DUF6677 family protein [Anaerovoracaceae bacterium]